MTRPHSTRGTRLLTSPDPTFFAITLSAVVAFLIIGMPLTALGLVALYLMSGYAYGRLPAVSRYVFAEIMLIAGMVDAMIEGSEWAVIMFGGLSLVVGAAPWVISWHRSKRAPLSGDR